MDFVSLDRTHVMTISRGPLHEALSSYQTLVGWDEWLTPDAHDKEGSGKNNNCGDRMSAKGMKHEWEPLTAAERKLISELYPPHAWHLDGLISIIFEALFFIVNCIVNCVLDLINKIPQRHAPLFLLLQKGDNNYTHSTSTQQKIITNV